MGMRKPFSLESCQSNGGTVMHRNSANADSEEHKGRDGRSAKVDWWELDLILTPGDDLMSSLEGEWREEKRTGLVC